MRAFTQRRGEPAEFQFVADPYRSEARELGRVRGGIAEVHIRHDGIGITYGDGSTSWFTEDDE